MLNDLLNDPANAALKADWDNAPNGTGERLFQAARFITEMEYQHLAFEEFARKVQPLVNLFGEGGTGYNTSTDPTVIAATPDRSTCSSTAPRPTTVSTPARAMTRSAATTGTTGWRAATGTTT